MMEPKGQILPATKFGDLLTDLAKECETILEIGTWHGLGSTLCLSLGLVRPTQRMWTVDQSLEMWKEARSYYPEEYRIRFLKAHAIDILDEIPQKIDLILFDGNDLQTDTEFDLLVGRIQKYAALDDTRERKNVRQRRDLVGRWITVADVQDERNGWAVFKRP